MWAWLPRACARHAARQAARYPPRWRARSRLVRTRFWSRLSGSIRVRGRGSTSCCYAAPGCLRSLLRPWRAPSRRQWLRERGSAPCCRRPLGPSPPGRVVRAAWQGRRMKNRWRPQRIG
eukprot:scaffold18682_cov50-Phaeocystis_antarctica.AAC.2